MLAFSLAGPGRAPPGRVPKTTLKVTAQKGLGPLSQVLSGYEGNLPYDPLPQKVLLACCTLEPPSDTLLLGSNCGSWEQPSNPILAMSLVGMQRSTGRPTLSSFMADGGHNEEEKPSQRSGRGEQNQQRRRSRERPEFATNSL